MILNAFDKDKIHRVEFDDPDKISHTYITETNDLFIFSQKGGRYRLQYIDLDAGSRREASTKKYDCFRLQNLFQYTNGDVGNKPLIDVHVRGSSDKEVIDNNEKLMVFMLHQDELYSWTQSNADKREVSATAMRLRGLRKKELFEEYAREAWRFPQIRPPRKNAEHDQDASLESALIKVADTPAQNFYRLSDKSFFIMEEERDSGELFAQKIMQYSIEFSHSEKVCVHKEFVNSEVILNYSVDHVAHKILIFSKLNQLATNRDKKITLYDLAAKRIIYENEIQNPSLCGRLQSGLYTLVDGHIYFSNDVIKIRYDVINQTKNQ